MFEKIDGTEELSVDAITTEEKSKSLKNDSAISTVHIIYTKQALNSKI